MLKRNKTNIYFDLESKRQILLVAIALAVLIAVFFMKPIAQDLSYHQFADNLTILGVPNFWNVVSNLPFIVVGMLGLTALIKKSATGTLPELRNIYVIFFVGLIITGFGSAYYHWNPNNMTLVWDRLPMTVSFVAFFCVIFGENISITFARRMIYPLLIIGILAVIYWRVTEAKGVGDLRPYILVQFLPILMIPLIVWLYPSPFKGQRYIAMVLVAYVIAKLLERFDHQVYEILGFMSGHPIKHVAAAIGTYFFYLALIKRRLKV